MRKVSLYLLIVACALWMQIAAGQVNVASPAPVQSPAVTGQTVWVNTRSHVYHFAGTRWYGRTNQGKYVSESEALAEGDRAAQNEHHPAVVPASPALLADLAPSPFTTPSPPAEPAAPSPSPTATIVPADSLAICVTAIAAQSDPAKLSTLGSRAANPRLKRVMYYLAQARAAGADPGEVIDQAQKQNGSAGTPRAPLVKVSLLRNLKICDGLGLLTPENIAGLRRGGAPTVMRGPYAGQKAEVDHIVPLAQAPEIGNELANLEMLPATLNRAKSDKVGERQLALAKKFHGAGLISDATMTRLQARFQPAGTEKYQLDEQ